jgi:hypothetical protein
MPETSPKVTPTRGLDISLPALADGVSIYTPSAIVHIPSLGLAKSGIKRNLTIHYASRRFISNRGAVVGQIVGWSVRNPKWRRRNN